MRDRDDHTGASKTAPHIRKTNGSTFPSCNNDRIFIDQLPFDAVVPIFVPAQSFPQGPITNQPLFTA
jgi:hypothetical protein